MVCMTEYASTAEPGFPGIWMDVRFGVTFHIFLFLFFDALVWCRLVMSKTIISISLFEKEVEAFLAQYHSGQ